MKRKVYLLYDGRGLNGFFPTIDAALEREYDLEQLFPFLSLRIYEKTYSRKQIESLIDDEMPIERWQEFEVVK